MINKNQLSTEDYESCSKLKSMRFSGMAEAVEEVFADPNAELLPFREKIQRIVDAELNLRYSKKLNRFIKKATLKYPAADLDETLYNPERQLDVRIIEAVSYTHLAVGCPDHLHSGSGRTCSTRCFKAFYFGTAYL